MIKTLTDFEKTLSYVLRHKPDAIGLDLDSGGWADIDELLRKLDEGLKLDRDLLEKVVKDSKKKRFSISDDGKRIRANQGHSIKVDLGLKEQIPPSILYHGTSANNLDSILNEGLKSLARNHVHLSSDYEQAKIVGSRHGKPVVLKINSKKMHDDGIKFYLSENNVWLTGNIDKKYFSRILKR